MKILRWKKGQFEREHRAVFASVGLLMAGCTAQMVSARGTSPYAPKSEKPGGEIKYLAQGVSDVVTARREDAYRQMFQHCSGKYTIDREWDEVSGVYTSVWSDSQTKGSAQAYASPYGASGTYSANTQGNASAYSSAMVYRHIGFTCSVTNAETPSVPEKPQTLLKRARHLARVGRVSDAMHLLSLCTQQEPAHGACLYERSLILRESGLGAKADEICMTILKTADAELYGAEIDACAKMIGPGPASPPSPDGGASSSATTPKEP